MFVPITFAWIGILIGMYIASPRKDWIAKVQSKGVRGALYNVDREHESFMYANAFNIFPSIRAVKWAQPILITARAFFGRSVKRNLWLAKEGIAYTQKTQEGKADNIPLASVVESLFESKDWKEVPQYVKNKANEGKVTITVDLGEETEQEIKARPNISSENINNEQDREFWQAFIIGLGKAGKANIPLFFGLAAIGGVAVTLLYMFTGHLC